MEAEIWKPIEGYEDSYEVSNLGSVRSKNRSISYYTKGTLRVSNRRSQILRPAWTGNAYCVRLYRNGLTKYFDLKHLVKTYFPEYYKQFTYNLNDSYVSKMHCTEDVKLNEIWKPIEGFEDYYEVSNTGKVRSRDRIVKLSGKRNGQIRVYKGKELSPLHARDHIMVKLHKDGYSVSISVGKLVALHFIDGFKESGRRKVYYKDKNPENCCVDNLE